MSATPTQLEPQVLDEAARPWGSWEVLDVGQNYKIKRITVRPHARLSLQTHHYRSEHWLVVVGVATCTVGTDQSLVEPGQHLYVPRGVVHRIANDGADDLIIVEIQVGSYTGEDDIVRLQDDYGRA